MDQIRDVVFETPAVDVCDMVSCRKAVPVDIFHVLRQSQTGRFLDTAAVPETVWNRDARPDERWEALRPHLDLIRNTAAFKALLKALSAILQMDVPDLDDSNWRDVSDGLTECNGREGYCATTLRRIARVEKVVRYSEEEGADTGCEEIFSALQDFDDFLLGFDPERRRALAADEDADIVSFADFIDMLESTFAKAVKRGIAGVKSTRGKFGTVNDQPVPPALAAQVFSRGGVDVPPPAIHQFQDFVFQCIVDLCVRYELPMVHFMPRDDVSLLAASNPMSMTGIFQRTPKARHLFLEAAFPFQGILGCCATKWACVFASFDTLVMRSPSLARRTLNDWLDLVPISKMTLIGSDSKCVEGTCAASILAREVLADVLIERVNAGYCGVADACEFARRLLYENALTIYGFEPSTTAAAVGGFDPAPTGTAS